VRRAGHPMSPMTTQRSGATASRSQARSTMPGAGLRQAQPSSGPCGQLCQVPNSPSKALTRAFTAVTSSAVSSPRATPDWLLTTPSCTPAARSRSHVSRARGITVTRSGSPLYGTSTTSVPSRSKSTASGSPRHGRTRRCRARPTAVWVAAANGMARLVASIVAISRAVRGPAAMRVAASSRTPAPASAPSPRATPGRRRVAMAPTVAATIPR